MNRWSGGKTGRSGSGPTWCSPNWRGRWSSARSVRPYAYRRSHTGRYVALAILTLLVLILIPTLVYVLMHQQ